MKKFVSLLFAVTLSASLFFSGCSESSNTESSASDDVEELVVCTWGGALETALQDAAEGFEEEFNCKITWDSYTDYSKIQTMVDSGNVYWDVCTMDAYWPYSGSDYLEEIDYDIVDKTGIEEYCYDYAVGAYTWATVIAYDSTIYNNETCPQSWTEFFDTEAFPGSRTFYKNAMYLFELALLADGVVPEDLYPIDIDQALAKLDEVKDSVTVWWESGSEPAQLLSSKEVELADAWAGRIRDAQEEGADVGMTFNQALIITDDWGVIKGIEHKDLAMEFINYMTRSEQQAIFSSEVPYGPVNSEAYALLDEEIIASIPAAEQYENIVVKFNPEWWAENYEEADAAFQEWLLE